MAGEAKYASIGGGKLYIKPIINGVPQIGEEYFGVTSDVNIKTSVEYKERENTEASEISIDVKVATKKTVGISFTTSEISPAVLARAFKAELTTVTQASGTVTSQSLTIGAKGLSYSVSKKMISSLIVKDDADAVIYALGVDYVVDAKRGSITILENGSITDDETLHLSFSYAEISYSNLEAMMSSSLEATLIFKSEPLNGETYDYTFHKVSLNQSGDFALKGSDFTTLTFEGDVLKDSTQLSGSEFFKIEKI